VKGTPASAAWPLARSVRNSVAFVSMEREG
jgi:hypothetical protein